MQNSSEELSEIHELERNIEALQWENANLAIDQEFLKNFIAGCRRKSTEYKEKAERIADQKKQDDNSLQRLKADNETLNKLQHIAATRKFLDEDLDEIEVAVGKLLNSKNEDECNNIISPATDLIELVTEDAAHWKKLEAKAKKIEAEHEDLRAQIKVAKKEKLEKRAEHQMEKQASAAKVIRNLYSLKQATLKYRETLAVYEDYQKESNELDKEIADLKKRLNDATITPKEHNAETTAPVSMVPPLKLAPVDLSLDQFKDPNECLPKVVPAAKNLQDTPRPFKSTGSYAALLPKILKMDKQSHMIPKRKMAAKKLGTRLFMVTKDITVSKPQPPAEEIHQPASVGADAESAPELSKENVNVNRNSEHKAEESPTKVAVQATTGPRKSPRLAEKNAGIQQKSPQPTPPSVETENQTQLEVENQETEATRAGNTTHKQDEPLRNATVEVEDPMNNEDNVLELSPNTSSGGQTPHSGIQTTSVEKEQGREMSQNVYEIRSPPSPTSRSPKSPVNFKLFNMQDKSPSVQNVKEIEARSPAFSVQSPASKLQPNNLDSILGGSEGSEPWGFVNNDRGNNMLFGPETAKNSTSNDVDVFDFFTSSGGVEPSDLFGNCSKDTNNFSLF